MGKVQEELELLINAAIVTFYTIAKLDDGNENYLAALDDDSSDENREEVSGKVMDAVLGPVLGRMIELMTKLAFSEDGEEELDGIDPESLFPANSKVFMERFYENNEKAQTFLENTSKKNQIVVAQVVKATTELNGFVNENEKKALENFCKKYNISEEELIGTNEDSALLEAFLKSENH